MRHAPPEPAVQAAAPRATLESTIGGETVSQLVVATRIVRPPWLRVPMTVTPVAKRPSASRRLLLSLADAVGRVMHGFRFR
jgi:hypothetical protein